MGRGIDTLRIYKKPNILLQNNADFEELDLGWIKRICVTSNSGSFYIKFASDGDILELNQYDVWDSEWVDFNCDVWIKGDVIVEYWDD